MKVTQSIAPATTDALLRTWGAWVAAQLAAVGWVQVYANTNWATETRPGGANTALAHYEIWRMADTLQSTAPIFMKLEYGTGGTSTQSFGLWTTFATAWDGVSALTGITSPRTATSQKDHASTSTWLISGDTNRLLIAASIDVGQADQGMLMAVERTHDSLGNDTADGLLWMGAGCTGGGGADSIGDWKAYYWPAGATSPGTETIGIFPPTINTGTDGTTTAVYPVYISKGPYLDPPRAIFGCFANDYVVGSSNSIPMYGASATYYRVHATTYLNASRYATANTVTILARYD
jgi:hypothetical protein